MCCYWYTVPCACIEIVEGLNLGLTKWIKKFDALLCKYIISFSEDWEAAWFGISCGTGCCCARGKSGASGVGALSEEANLSLVCFLFCFLGGFFCIYNCISVFLHSRYLNKAFHIWSKKDKFSPSFINNMVSHTDTKHSAPAWMLLSKIACSSPKLDYTKIIQSWEKISRCVRLFLFHPEGALTVSGNKVDG